MPMMIAALVGSALILYTVRKRRLRYGKLLFALSALIILWLLFYMLELLLPNESDKRLMLDLQYIALPYIAPVYFLYTLYFTGVKPPSSSLVTLFMLPVNTSVACWTNASHSLFFTALRVNSFSMTGALVRTHGVMFYIHVVFIALLLFIGSSKLIFTYARISRQYQRQLTLLLCAAILPALSGAASLAFRTPFDFTPVSLILSVYLLLWLVNDYTFLPVMPMLRDACYEMTDSALFLIDDERRILDVNPAACSMLQKRPNELIMGDFSALFGRFAQGARLSLSAEEEFRVSRGAADAYYSVHTNRLGDDTFVTIRDIGERKREEERHSYFSNFDSLTSLPNRSLFYKLLQRELDQVKRFGDELLLLIIDVDGFHDLNELYGYQAGDRVLIELAKRLGESLRKVDTIARFENDEFHVILPKLAIEDAPALIERLLGALSAPIKSGNVQIEFTLSIGIARAPEDTSVPDELLTLARTALRSHQPKTRNSYRLYTPEIEDGAQHAGGDLRCALDSGAAKCAFIPIEDASGSAALIQGRVFLERGRELFPGPVLTSYAPEIELRLMHMLLAEHHARNAEGPLLLLPFEQRLLKPEFVERFCQSMRQFGYERSGLALIVHSVVLSHRSEDVRASLKKLRESGAKLVLDGFEASYSLARLVIASEIEHVRLSKGLTESIMDEAGLLLAEAAQYLAERSGVKLHAIASGTATEEKLRQAGVNWIGIL